MEQTELRAADAPTARPGRQVAGRRVLAVLLVAVVVVAGAVAVWAHLAPPVPDARERLREGALPKALRFL